jgi:hypothetical protein
MVPTKRVYREVSKGKYELGEVIETKLSGNRFFVKVQYSDGTVKRMPRSHYSWLKFNPSFYFIPDGYVIHHLDFDPTNDDPSNLALITKYAHDAYHMKHKVVEVKIMIDDLSHEYSPYLEPLVRFDKKANQFYVRIMEKKHGIGRRRAVYTLNGKRFANEEEAQAFKDTIWPPEGQKAKSIA